MFCDCEDGGWDLCANNNAVLALVWESSRFCLYRPGLRFIACLELVLSSNFFVAFIKVSLGPSSSVPFHFFANVLPLHRENRGRCSGRYNRHTADFCLQEWDRFQTDGAVEYVWTLIYCWCSTFLLINFRLHKPWTDKHKRQMFHTLPLTFLTCCQKHHLAHRRIRFTIFGVKGKFWFPIPPDLINPSSR